MLTESTRETADTAASPTLEIMTESAMPTNMARNCSATSGRMMRKMSLRLKISPSGGFFIGNPSPKQKLRLKLILLFLGKSVKKGKGLRSALRRQRLFRHGFPVQEYSIKRGPLFSGRIHKNGK